MRKMFFAIVVMTLVFSVGAMAQNDNTSGTLLVKATLQSSIYMTLENASGGPSLTNAGTPAATLDFGNVFAYGTYAPTGITRSLNMSGGYATSFTLATSFGVRVGMYNTNSETKYGLTAALNAADAANTWVVDSVTLTTTAQAVTGGTGFNAVVPHSLSLTIPQSTAAGSIQNTINLAAAAQ